MIARRSEIVHPSSTKAFVLRHHCVYVVELDRAVLDKKRMQKANPGCRSDLPPLYVGQTGLTPEERFAKHRSGVKANPYVRDHGVRLRPDLYDGFGLMSWEQSCRTEQELAARLREAGYAVWTN